MNDAGVTPGVTDAGVTIPAAVPMPAQGSSMAVFLVLAAISFLPMLLLAATSFVKISIVLGMVRNAIGTQNVPGNTAITGLALLLSFQIMLPTLSVMSTAAGPHLSRVNLSAPLGTESTAALSDAWKAARGPLARFLKANSSPKDRALFLGLATRSRKEQHEARPEVSATAPAPDDVSVLLPAFVLSELTSAFMLGLLLLLPFLVLDLVIANILAAASLHGVSQQSVALPFKLALFLAADGWYMLARALMLGYH